MDRDSNMKCIAENIVTITNNNFNLSNDIIPVDRIKPDGRENGVENEIIVKVEIYIVWYAPQVAPAIAAQR